MTVEISTVAAQEPATLERLIAQVRGVHAVRVVAGQGGQIDEVHVVGAPARAPKAIVRDIESILYVRGGVRLDHRKISLVQIAETAVRPAAPRLQLVEARRDDTPDGTAVTVTLRLCDRQVEGVGSSRPGQPADLPLLTAYATIHAIAACFGPRGCLYLDRLQRQPFGEHEVYIAQLTSDVDGVAETLLGISVLRDDELLTVARTVLDAANRRLARLLGEGAESLG